MVPGTVYATLKGHTTFSQMFGCYGRTRENGSLLRMVLNSFYKLLWLWILGGFCTQDSVCWWVRMGWESRIPFPPRKLRGVSDRMKQHYSHLGNKSLVMLMALFYLELSQFQAGLSTLHKILIIHVFIMWVPWLNPRTYSLWRCTFFFFFSLSYWSTFPISNLTFWLQPCALCLPLKILVNTQMCDPKWEPPSTPNISE